MRELDERIYAQVLAFSKEGDEWAEIGEFGLAVAAYEKALALVPEPKTDWNTSTWLLTAIGDAWFLAGEFQKARDSLRHAILCPDATGNPFVHLRRGQTFFELGELKEAQDELAGAYMLEGTTIFEEEDPKYFEYLKTVMRPPANGKW